MSPRSFQHPHHVAVSDAARLRVGGVHLQRGLILHHLERGIQNVLRVHVQAISDTGCTRAGTSQPARPRAVVVARHSPTWAPLRRMPSWTRCRTRTTVSVLYPAPSAYTMAGSLQRVGAAVDSLNHVVPIEIIPRGVVGAHELQTQFLVGLAPIRFHTRLLRQQRHDFHVELALAHGLDGWLNMAHGLRSTRSQCSQYVQAGSTTSEYFAVHVHHGSTVTMKSMAITSLMMRLESGLMLMKFELAIHKNSMGTGSCLTAAAYTLRTDAPSARVRPVVEVVHGTGVAGNRLVGGRAGHARPRPPAPRCTRQP